MSIKQTMELSPESAEYHYSQGVSYHNKGEYEKAIESKKQAIELSPENEKYYDSISNSYHAKGEYDEAIKFAKQALELSPENAEYHDSISSSYHAKGEYDEAIKFAKQAIELSPENAEYHDSISSSYHAKGEYDEAIKFAKQAVELSPDNAEYFYSLGVSYHEKGEYNKAIESKKQAIELSPNSADYHYSLGVSYHTKSEYDKAIESKKQAIELSPENAKYRDSISNSYHAQGEYEEAIKYAKQALDLSPKNAEYHYSLGASYHEQGEYDKAIESKKQAIKFAEKVLELSPYYAEYHYSLGVSYHAKGEYEKAIESKKQAIELSPENAKYHDSISISYHVKGEYNEAIKFAKQAIEFSPENAEYLYSLSVSYYEKGEYNKSIKYVKQANNLSPNNANYHYLLGLSYYRKKDIVEAIETLHYAIRLDKSAAVLYETLVFIHCKEARYEDQSQHEKLVELIVEGINTNNWDSEIISRILNIFHKKVEFESLANVLSRLKELPIDSIFYRIQKVLRSFEKYPDFHPTIAKLHYLTAQIMNELSVKRDEDITLAHYTKVATIRHLIKPHKATRAVEKEAIPKIRLSNATYMNDPSEGTKLLEYFDSFGENALLQECCDILIGSNEFEYKSSNVYLFSMTTYIDKLPMWSQYGDDGQGCCLELKKENFDYVDNELYHNIVMNDIETLDGKDKLHKVKREFPPSYRYIPYKVYYFDSKPGEESDKIKENLNQIHSVIAQLDKLVSQNDNIQLREQMKLYIIECLDQIRFLFKSNDYDHEQEARLLVYVPENSEKIKLDETVELAPKLYVEMDNNKGIEYSSIILGPKFKCPELIVPYIHYCNGDITIKKSQVKYR